MVPVSMKNISGKHKRGERGSLEEEDNVSKRCVMADSVGEAQKAAATQLKLNLTDIKELLVDIQITVATILRENQELKQEILELKFALTVNQRDELNHIRMKLKDQIKEMNKLDQKHDDLEQ